MSAGTGIRRSKYNHENETTGIFQIWIMPTRSGEAPIWGARTFPKGLRSGQFLVLASGYKDGGDALPIGTDAGVIGATMHAGKTAS